MHCDNCAKRVIIALKNLDGINDVKVSLENKQVTIDSDESIDKKIIIEKIEDLGFNVIDF